MRTARCCIAVALVVLAGCETRETTRTEVVLSVGSESNTNTPIAPAIGGTMRVAFRDVVTETPGCFFFSGPGDLGRDDLLGDVATYDGSALRFSPSIVFVTQATSTLVLLRESSHAFNGSWRVVETITLIRAGEGLGEGYVGRYHYDEIDPSTSAPSACHIDARIELWP